MYLYRKTESERERERKSIQEIEWWINKHREYSIDNQSVYDISQQICYRLGHGEV